MERFSFEQEYSPAQEKLHEIATALQEIFEAGPSSADPLDDLPPEAGEILSLASSFFSPLLKALQEKDGKEREENVHSALVCLVKKNPSVLKILAPYDTNELARQWRSFLWVAQWRKQQKI